MTATSRSSTPHAAIWRTSADIPFTLDASVVTIGVFDGMHRGHARLIGTAVELARQRCLPAVLVTFDPHPAQVLGLPKDTSRLSSIARRAELAHQLGIDAVYVIGFTPEIARHSPRRFVEEILADTLRARAVVVGENFTFGHRGAGTVDTLHGLGAAVDFTTHLVALFGELDTVTSSSRVRSCLRQGDLGGASRALGRPHRIEGRLEPLELYDGAFIPEPGAAVPAPGHYTARLVGGGCMDLTVTSDGTLLVQGPLAAGTATIELQPTTRPTTAPGPSAFAPISA